MNTKPDATGNTATEAQAEAEDALDAAWLAKADRMRCLAAGEYAGSDPVERTMAGLRAKLTARPAGFIDRIYRCNRCGHPTE